jgi:uncharacterized protein YdaU (DUF1376 family)
VDWYPFYPTDFRRDTLHLSLAEDGAYRRLIDEYMILRGPLPDDDAALSRLLGVGIEEWLKVAPAVRKFFRSAANGLLFHRRCDREIAAQNNRNSRLSQRGKKAAFAKWNNFNAVHPRRMLVHPTVHNNSNPRTNSEPTAPQQEASEEEGELARLVRQKGWVR